LLFRREWHLSAQEVMTNAKILIGWTTVDSAAVADKLAASLVAARLAACAQVDGPVTAHYIWEGKPERATEWRVWVKFPAKHAKKIAAWLKTHHPYSTPQWLAVEAAAVAGPYRRWVEASTHTPLKAGRKNN
jgi:periplasmic divalent cation tolerance protein